jgi:polygalacturonase
MSGGISNVVVEHVNLDNSKGGIEFRTVRGRGGYMKEILISDVEMRNINTAIVATGYCGSHPDDKFDPNALPTLDHFILQDIIGTNISIAGSFVGLQESPFTNICLSNITLFVNYASSTTWNCSNVSGVSDSVIPKPCPDLDSPSNYSSSCLSMLSMKGKTAVSGMVSMK